MRKQFPPDELARDGRFNRMTTIERFSDPRNELDDRKLDRNAEDVADRARRQMHGIFVGEIQALEGAGRTGNESSSPDEIPYASQLILDGPGGAGRGHV